MQKYQKALNQLSLTGDHAGGQGAGPRGATGGVGGQGCAPSPEGAAEDAFVKAGRVSKLHLYSLTVQRLHFLYKAPWQYIENLEPW